MRRRHSHGWWTQATTTADLYRRRYDDDDDDTEQTRPSLACPHFHSLPSIHLVMDDYLRAVFSSTRTPLIQHNMMILLLPISLICVQCFHPRGLPSSSTTRWFCCLSARFVHTCFIHEDSPHWAQHDDSVVAYQLDMCAVFSSTITPLIQHNMMILCLSAWIVCIVFIQKDSPHPASHDNSVAYQLDLCAVFSSTRTPLIQHNMMILLPITPTSSPKKNVTNNPGRNGRMVRPVAPSPKLGSRLGPGINGHQGYAPWHKNVVGEIPVLVHSPEGGALEGVSPRVFPNLRRTHGASPYVSNSLSIAFASFLFGRKEIFPWERENT
jgi:hypothetical protein